MVNIKEDYRLLAGIFLSSGSATNEPLEEAYAVPELEEEIPISPYEYRPTKRAGTYPVYRSYRSRRIAKLQRIPKIRGWQIPEVYHAPSHTSPVYKFVHKLHDDQSLEMSDVDVWEFE